MKAVILPHGGDRAAAVQKLAEAVPGFRPEDHLVLSLAAKRMNFPTAGAEDLSVFTPFADHAFESVLVGPGFRLFHSNWGRAFLVGLYQMVAPKGTLVVPYHDAGAAAANGYLSLGQIQEALQQSGRALSKPAGGGLLGGLKNLVRGPADGGGGAALAEFTRGPDLPPPPSILSWFLRRSSHAVLTAVECEPLRAIPDWAGSWFTEFLAGGELGAGAHKARGGESGVDDQTTYLMSKAKSLSYLVHGPSYKNAVLNKILADHFKGRRDLSVVDHGGGPGFLAAELLLENPAVARAVTCDINPQYVWPALDLYLHYKDRLGGRLTFSVGPAQDYTYDRPHDCVTFVGSLLYVPRESTKATLDRAWAALKPGGLLVVHENIRNPAFTKDHDVMFTVEELDGFLTAYAPVTHYSSTRAARVSAGDVGTSTVFRVVQKA